MHRSATQHGPRRTGSPRRYDVQNWRADVVAVTKSNGDPLQYVVYSPYGEPVTHAVADVDLDGDVDASDQTAWANGAPNSTFAYAALEDLNHDGTDSAADDALFDESYTDNLGLSGRGRLTAAKLDNRKGYAGYEHDESLTMYHVRHRVYRPDLGRWMTRDPLGYVDGMGLYEYVRGMAVRGRDPSGLCSRGSCQGQPWEPVIRPEFPIIPLPGPRTPPMPQLPIAPGPFAPGLVNPCAGAIAQLDAARSGYSAAWTSFLQCIGADLLGDATCVAASIANLNAARAAVGAACVSLRQCEFERGVPLTHCNTHPYADPIGPVGPVIPFVPFHPGIVRPGVENPTDPVPEAPPSNPCLAGVNHDPDIPNMTQCQGRAACHKCCFNAGDKDIDWCADCAIKNGMQHLQACSERVARIMGECYDRCDALYPTSVQ